MDQKVNYKNPRRSKPNFPIRQPLFFVGLIWVLSKIALMGKRYRIEKIGLEGLKPPYILLSNHMYFIDFMLGAVGTFPHRVNNVVHIDGYYRRPWLMDLIGAIRTRKFTADLHLVRAIRKVLQRGDVLCMYPEARYSPCGTTAFLPESLGKLIKMNHVPVVVTIHHGNHLDSPFWNFRKKRKVPLYTTMTKILTPEQIDAMTPEQINQAVQAAFQYDDYRYQKENGILITEPYRAEGLHKVLYQCPSCLTESKMDSKGTELFCTHCGKRWNLEEDGSLRALEGDTEFPHVPDWFHWQRTQVQKQIEAGTYHFCDDVDVYSIPRAGSFVHLGPARITHDIQEGFVLEGFYNGKPYRIQRKPLEINSLHVEYDYCYLKPLDCLDISTEDDSFTCYPANAKNIVTKLAFATEILYQSHLNQKRGKPFTPAQ